MSINELWLPVEGYEGLYLVSNAGSIMTLPKHGKPGHLLKQRKNNSGYLVVRLGRNGVLRDCLVHRLVAAAFCDNPQLKREVNHIDGDKLNNHAPNLEWVTTQENNVHKRDVLGTANSPHPSRRLFTPEQVRAIRSSGKPNRVLAREYGVSHSAIASIKTRRVYKEVA